MPVAAYDPPAPFAPDDEWRAFERDIRSLISRSSESDARELRRLLDSSLAAHNRSPEFGVIKRESRDE